MPSQRAVTAPDGTFRLGNLSDGPCTVDLWVARGQKPEWVAEDVRISLTAGQTKRDVRMEITKGAFIEALIKDTAGKPVEKVGVYFRRVGQEQGFGDRTDANGLARIRVLPGAYSLSQIYRPGYAPPETTDPVTVAEGQTQRVEYIVTAKPKVAGIVRDEAGNPLAGVKVQATWIRMSSAGTSGAVSDASGKFEFPWDTSLPGRAVTAVIFVARDPSRNLAAVLDIDESTGPLDLRLQPGVIVTGTVLNEAGQPLPGANVRVLLRADRMMMTRLSWDELATAGPDGVFEVKAVPPERQYTVEVTADGYGKQSVPIATLDPQEKRHDIGRIKLVSSDLSVSGVVVDANDQPVAGMEVSAFGDGQPDLRNVQTDARGQFTIKGVSPGSIRLSAGAPGVSPLRGSAQAEAGATDVKITVADRRSYPGPIRPARCLAHGQTSAIVERLGDRFDRRCGRQDAAGVFLGHGPAAVPQLLDAVGGPGRTAPGEERDGGRRACRQHRREGLESVGPGEQDSLHRRVHHGGHREDEIRLGSDLSAAPDPDG